VEPPGAVARPSLAGCAGYEPLRIADGNTPRATVGRNGALPHGRGIEPARFSTTGALGDALAACGAKLGRVSAPLALTRLAFQAGAADGAPPLEIAPGVITVLVGPNNSGKSRALADIAGWAQGGPASGIVIRDVDAQWPSSVDEALELLSSYVQSDPRPGVVRVQAPTVAGGGGGSEEIDAETFRTVLADEESALPEHLSGTRRRLTLRFFTALWTGRERFALASDQQLSDLQGPSQNHLQVLFRDDNLRARLRELIHQAFGLYFVLDPTQPGQIRMRLSREAPPSPSVERGLDEKAIRFHAETLPLQEQSDGIQCYVGMITALLSLPLRLVLIDEPEAFLHPPLARRLGGAVAEIARDRDARVVAATHSAEFLRGCVESPAATSIVRLTYERATGKATARSLTTGELRPLMAEPLLRSTRALEGLFHRAVVVGESDSDRAFYDEINRRLRVVGRGVVDAQFVNAQNWSTEARVIGPLRRLGVPAAGILDLDTLWNSKSEWRPLYRAVGLTDGDPERLRLEAEQAFLARDASERAACKKRGIAALPAAKRSRMRAFLAELAEYGIFVVPGGELESWLRSLGVPASPKHAWIVQMLTKLGTDPGKPDYVHPARGGVWRFLDGIERWVQNPARKGIPA
jgi:ABC-type lipoprotein export system ATPase subunit